MISLTSPACFSMSSTALAQNSSSLLSSLPISPTRASSSFHSHEKPHFSDFQKLSHQMTKLLKHESTIVSLQALANQYFVTSESFNHSSSHLSPSSSSAFQANFSSSTNQTVLPFARVHDILEERSPLPAQALQKHCVAKDTQSLQKEDLDQRITNPQTEESETETTISQLNSTSSLSLSSNSSSRVQSPLTIDESQITLQCSTEELEQLNSAEGSHLQQVNSHPLPQLAHPLSQKPEKISTRSYVLLKSQLKKTDFDPLKLQILAMPYIDSENSFPVRSLAEELASQEIFISYQL